MPRGLVGVFLCPFGLGIGGGVDREVDDECGSFDGVGAVCYYPVVFLDEVFYEVQANTESSGLAVAESVEEAFEAGEQFFVFLDGDSHAVVGDLYFHVCAEGVLGFPFGVVCQLEAHDDVSFRRGILDCVEQQVVHYFFEFVGVVDCLYAFVGACEVDRQVLFSGVDVVEAYDVVDL